MFERFTDRARASVVLAQDQARQLRHNYIGTEHLLLGLLAESEGVAGRVLAEMGVRLEAIHADVEQIVGEGDEEPPSGHIPFTPRAKKVLELSLREALQLGHNYIGTEHILLGIVREGQGVAAQALARHGTFTLDEMRERVRARLSDQPRRQQRERTPAAHETLLAAERLAGGAPVGTHHVLAALVRAEGSMAANALSALGVDQESVAGKLAELRIEDTTDITAEEAAARQMELQLHDDEVHLIVRDPATLERTKRVLERVGGPVKGAEATTHGFVAVWRELQNSLARTEGALTTPEPAHTDVKRSRRRRRKPST